MSPVGPACRFDEFPYSSAVAVDRLGLAPVDAIAHATSHAARALRIDAQVGTVAPGKRADLSLVDGDPSQGVLDLRNVRTVIQNGTFRVWDGLLASTAPQGHHSGGTFRHIR